MHEESCRRTGAFIGSRSTSLVQEILTPNLMFPSSSSSNAMAFVDQRAPGVSAALRVRIGTLLDGGASISLRRNSLVLHDVVLTRANGSETPAAAELRLQSARRGLDPANLDRWNRSAAVEQEGNQRFAFDRDGTRHMVSRRRFDADGNRRRVVTAAGRRFYQDAPMTQ